jgi:hypothetical protein
MSEPAGLIFECQINETKLNQFFKTKIVKDSSKITVGHLFCEILESTKTEDDVFIINHDPKVNRLFIAWVFNFYSSEMLAPIWSALETLSALIQSENELFFGVISSTFPEAYETVKLENGQVTFHPADLIAADKLQHLANKFLSFEIKEQFPDAESSMQTKNYHCKVFKAEWKKFVKLRADELLPQKIKAATPNNPLLLCDDIYTVDGVVFQRHDYTRRDIIFPKADPYSFRNAGRFYADQNYVWQRQLAVDSPSEAIMKGSFKVNNPAAIWEYVIVPGAIGKKFKWLFDRHDTIYWADQNSVYSINEINRGLLVKLPDVNPKEFKDIGCAYGSDQKQVFYLTKALTINATNNKTEEFFIWDDKKVFFRDLELPLNGHDFQILGKKYLKGVRLYRLTDGKNTFLIDPKGEILPDNPSLFNKS